MDERVRLLQTNLTEIDPTLDIKRLVKQLAEFLANKLLINLSSIVAQCPTHVEFHYASPHLPLGRNLFGKVLQEVHTRHSHDRLLRFEQDAATDLRQAV